jgi:hypothetical protein
LEDAITAAISASAASLEAASATTDASTASTADTSSTESFTSTDATGAVDIPSGEPAAEVAADPALEVAGDEIQDPSVPQGHMPLHRHKAVLTKARNEAKAAVEAVQTQLESLKWAQDPGMPDRLKALEIAEANPELFVQVLKQDPRYAKLLNTPAEQPAIPQKPQAAAPALGERPGPDRQDDQGNIYYSAEQAAALQEWIEQAQEARTKALFDERFAPIEKERQEAAHRAEQETMWKGAVDRQKSILTDARATWPLFSELEVAIKADLAKNTTMSLETAYRRAFVPRTQANRDAMRKEILAELNNRPPVAASTRPGPGPAVKPAGQRTTEDIITEIARGLEANG